MVLFGGVGVVEAIGEADTVDAILGNPVDHPRPRDAKDVVDGRHNVVAVGELGPRLRVRLDLCRPADYAARPIRAAVTATVVSPSSKSNGTMRKPWPPRSVLQRDRQSQRIRVPTSLKAHFFLNYPVQDALSSQPHPPSVPVADRLRSS